jgi:flagellin
MKMSGIVLSASVRQNLLSLHSTATLLATTQNDLATGNKVNSALDNPTNFFTSQGLNNRASDINNLLDGIGNGVQVLQAANTGITSLQSLVASAQSIANQVLQAPAGYTTKSNVTTTAITGATASNLLGTPTAFTSATFTTAAALTDSTTATTVTGATALSGGTTSTDGLATSIAAGSTLVVDGKTITFVTTGATSTSATGGSINLTTGKVSDVLAAIDQITGSAAGTSVVTGGKLVLATGTTGPLTITGTAGTLTSLGLGTGVNQAPGGGTTALGGLTLTIAATLPSLTATSLTFGTGNGQISTLNQLNTALAANDLQASIDSTGAINIVTTNNAASATLGAISGTAVTTSGAAFASLGAGGAAPVADPNSQATRASLVAQYNNVLQQINTTSQDSSFNGINLLNGDTLNLTFDETGASKLAISGVTFNTAGLGLSSLTQGTDFRDNNSANTALTALTNASTTLRSEASALGSNLSIVQIRQDFNKNLINVLQTGSSNLTLADTNQEAANSQALSTRQSIAVSALALANQSQQSVLQLLR